ncbi:MAG: L,D-transpeptidase [Bdellovibrionota bacterium]
MRSNSIFLRISLLGLILFVSPGAKALTGDNEKLNEFSQKDLQITIIKNPESVLKTGFLGFNKTKDEVVIVRAKGKIIRTFVTSTAMAGKETPDGIYNTIVRADENHESDIYHSEMDWALFLDKDIALHSTTENHYEQLGRPASMGCIRLLREDARELFKIAKGQIITPEIGVQKDYVAGDDIGVNLLPKASVKSYWESLPRSEQDLIIKMAKADKKKVLAQDIDFKKNGDTISDEFENSKDSPSVHHRSVPSQQFSH